MHHPSTNTAARRFAAGLGLLALLAPGARAETYTAREICECVVTSLSADGRAATGQLNYSQQTFRWAVGEGLQPLGRGTMRKLGYYFGNPKISGDGQTIASTIIDDTHSYGIQGRWTAATGWQQLPLPADAVIVDETHMGSVANGLSRDGTVVAGHYPDLASGRPSRWSEDTGMQALGYGGEINAVNGDGRVLVGERAGKAMVWIDGEPTALDAGMAFGVNAAGDIVVGGTPRAPSGRLTPAMWVWRDGAWHRRLLGTLAGQRFSRGYATAVSDDGRIVVGNGDWADGGWRQERAFIWTEPDGLVEAEQYFESRGYPVSQRLFVKRIDAISGDGRVIGVVGTDVATGHHRSLAVERVEP